MSAIRKPKTAPQLVRENAPPAPTHSPAVRLLRTFPWEVDPPHDVGVHVGAEFTSQYWTLLVRLNDGAERAETSIVTLELFALPINRAYAAHSEIAGGVTFEADAYHLADLGHLLIGAEATLRRLGLARTPA